MNDPYTPETTTVHTNPQRSANLLGLHPLIAAAAIAVLALSGVGRDDGFRPGGARFAERSHPRIACPVSPRLSRRTAPPSAPWCWAPAPGRRRVYPR